MQKDVCRHAKRDRHAAATYQKNQRLLEVWEQCSGLYRCTSFEHHAKFSRQDECKPTPPDQTLTRTLQLKPTAQDSHQTQLRHVTDRASQDCPRITPEPNAAVLIMFVSRPFRDHPIVVTLMRTRVSNAGFLQCLRMQPPEASIINQSLLPGT